MAEPGRAETGRGLGRILVAVYAVLALAATGRSVVQLVDEVASGLDAALVPYGLSALAAVVYVVATVGLARRGPAATRAAWAAVLTELVGVLVVGTLSVVEAAWLAEGTVWSQYGAGYGYLPLVLPFAGVAWLAHLRRGPAGDPGGDPGDDPDPDGMQLSPGALGHP